MRVVFRADGAQHIGMGHVTRSLALASELQDQGAEVFCVGHNISLGKAFAESFEHLNVIESNLDGNAPGAKELLTFEPDGVVVDGYHFSEEFFAVLERGLVPYAVIDDNGETCGTKPVLVHNQNPHALEHLYPNVTSSPAFLFGLDYALLRREVRELVKSPPKKSESILIGLGGTDVRNLTVPIARALMGAGHQVAIANSFRELLETTQRAPGAPSPVFYPPEQFPNALARASIAVLGAGGSLWEALALETPTVAVIVAENQVKGTMRAYELGYVSHVVNTLSGMANTKITDEIVRLMSTTKRSRFSKTLESSPTNGIRIVAESLKMVFSDSSLRVTNL